MSVRKDEIHVATLRELAEAHVEIARLTKAAALARMIAAITDAHGIDARDAFLEVAKRVLARNWTANPVTGAATP